MKSNRTTKIVFTLVVLAVLVGTAASSVRALPSYSGAVTNDECGNAGCHTTLGTLTLASNSTNVTGLTGEPFVLVLDAGSGADWITIFPAWEDNSEFVVSEQAIADESANDTNGVSGEISVSVTFIPLSPGNHTIRIWTAAGDHLSTSLDIAVSVSGEAITTNTQPTGQTFDPVATWHQLMIILPVSIGIALFAIGIAMIRRNS